MNTSKLGLGDQAQWTVSDATDGDDFHAVGIKVNSVDIGIPEHDGERTLVRVCVRATQDSGENRLGRSVDHWGERDH